MELNRKGQSLKVFFFKYLISIAIGLIIAVGVGLSAFTFFYNSNLVVPANYTESLILKNKDKLSNSKTLDLSLMPENTSYILISDEGKIVKSNMSNDITKKAVDFHKGNRSSNSFETFMEIKRPDGYLVIGYSVKPHYVNPWMEEHLPGLNILSSIILVLLCFLNSLLITVFWARRLAGQLKPMTKASEEISKQNLDFEIEKSGIKEFNEVLASMDKMKADLNESLKKNWTQEENRRNQISALTHDLKTPISIVQGNSELLKDTELTEEQEMYVDFIIKNSKRISDYAKALMIMNKSAEINEKNLEEFAVANVAEKLRNIAEEITSFKGFKLIESISADNGNIVADIGLIERAFQNIISNAVEYSQEESVIEFEFKTLENNLEITVKDCGRGFSDEDIAHGMEQFYRGDKSRHSATNYGLGLYSVKQIMELHNGELILKNREDRKGAEVILKLPLK